MEDMLAALMVKKADTTKAAATTDFIGIVGHRRVHGKMYFVCAYGPQGLTERYWDEEELEKHFPVLLQKYRESVGLDRVPQYYNEEFEVESIESHTVRDGTTYYNVRWTGYPDTTEAVEADFTGAQEILQEYKKANGL